MPVTGTNGNDVINFQGTLEQFTATLVNPYSGYSVFVDAIKRVNSTSYDGLGGEDVMFMTSTGDVIMLNDGNGNALLSNVEVIQAGGGDDILFLADLDLTLGDMTVYGSTGNDIIWMNSGNDTVYGGSGNDIIDGGPGNDRLFGDAGNDLIWGGAGDDNLYGGSGNDILYGGYGNDILIAGEGDNILYGGNGANDSPTEFAHTVYMKHVFAAVAYHGPVEKQPHAVIPVANQGIAPENLQISYNTTVHVEYIFSEAGYKNSLGFYKIGTDGVLSNVEIVFKNQHQISYGDTFTYQYEGVSGESLGIFILANGWTTDAFYRNLDLSTGTLHFIYDFGGVDQRPALISDYGADVKLVFDDGTTQTALNVTHYHSGLSGGFPTLNVDGKVHTISGLVDEDDTSLFRVGFEDLPYLGDADFDDIVFNMRVEDQEILVPGVEDNDILIGGSGNDTFYGGFGDDILVFGQGFDYLYGGPGNDLFLMNFVDALVDTIYDFVPGAGRDVLNLTDILQGYDLLSSAVDDFLQLVSVGTNDHLYVNVSGDPLQSFLHIITFDGGLGGVDLGTLLAQGNLVLDQSVVLNIT